MRVRMHVTVDVELDDDFMKQCWAAGGLDDEASQIADGEVCAFHSLKDRLEVDFRKPSDVVSYAVVAHQIISRDLPVVVP